MWPFNSNFSVAKKELRIIAHSIQRDGWRTKLFSDPEIALGYVAFYLWLTTHLSLLGRGDRKGADLFRECSNETARNIAVQLVNYVAENEKLLKAAKAVLPMFDPTRELPLALAKVPKSNPVWEPCTTRAVIMLCRTLVYAVSGQAGDIPKFLHKTGLDLDAIKAIGEQYLDESFGPGTAALFFHS